MNQIVECYKFEKDLRVKITEDIFHFYNELRQENDKLRKLDQKPDL